MPAPPPSQLPTLSMGPSRQASTDSAISCRPSALRPVPSDTPASTAPQLPTFSARPAYAGTPALTAFPLPTFSVETSPLGHASTESTSAADLQRETSPRRHAGADSTSAADLERGDQSPQARQHRKRGQLPRLRVLLTRHILDRHGEARRLRLHPDRMNVARQPGIR